MKIDWDEEYSKGRDYSKVNRLLLEKILAKTPKTGRALDVGCGTGDLACKLALKGYDVTAIDLSEIAIAQAKARAKELNLKSNTEFIVGKIESVSKLLGKETFELIICKHTYAFIEDKEGFLNIMKSLLSPNGSFVLITPVLLPAVAYKSEKIKRISVDLEPTKRLLQQVFARVDVLSTDYFDEEGVCITFACSKALGKKQHLNML